MSKVLVTTVPFAASSRLPIEMLEASEIEYVINPLRRKLKEDELAEMIGDFDVVIAGTESITQKVIDRAKRLKLISRVGVGLDSVDLNAARRRDILVSYTPDAPAPAVAELTLGAILTLLRHLHSSNSGMHRGEWNRFFGRRISEVKFGIIGAGRIGGRVIQMLSSLGAPKIMVNDVNPGSEIYQHSNIDWVDKEIIYKEADLISLHLPLTEVTKNMIGIEQIKQMKRDAFLVNTSRGGIINEADLAFALNSGLVSGAAIDVFEKEPYNGDLQNIEKCLLTSHMGSMSMDCRTQMEVEATEEAVRFLTGQHLRSLVPEEEYAMQIAGGHQ